MVMSGKGQVDGDGFPREREAIAHCAKSAGLELLDEATRAWGDASGCLPTAYLGH